MLLKKSTMQDDVGEFELWTHLPDSPKAGILFAVGRGGKPTMHMPFLERWAKEGFALVAPAFDFLTNPRVSEEILVQRANRINVVAQKLPINRVPCIGIGHSIGASTLLLLSGAKGWLGPNHALPPMGRLSLAGLILMAPPSGFFRGPGALAEMNLPCLLWGGESDSIVSTTEMSFLHKSITGEAELSLLAGADHFSFMDIRPPHMQGKLPGQAEILSTVQEGSLEFAERICIHSR